MNRYSALKHAVKAHAGQLDKAGKPYILHPIAVAEAVDGTTAQLDNRESAVIVALLHDVWEDTEYMIDFDEFTPLEWNAMTCITRWPGESYSEYIEKVCTSPIAMIVKLADLSHNLSPARQASLPLREARGLERRYLKSRDRIWDALGAEWWPA